MNNLNTIISKSTLDSLVNPLKTLTINYNNYSHILINLHSLSNHMQIFLIFNQIFLNNKFLISKI